MTRAERADKIESIVGSPRHLTLHLARAVKSEQRVYIMHSHQCCAETLDLRDCRYSCALDIGIDLDIWGDFQDQVVELGLIGGCIMRDGVCLNCGAQVQPDGSE